MSEPTLESRGPHQGQPIFSAGPALDSAKAAMIMVHGRGATAESIVSSLISALNQTDFAYLAPQAAGNTWYPYGFMSPIPENEPGISSGMAAIEALVAQIEQAGISTERIFLLGFSQGACLSLEYAARNAQRFGGVVGLSGGLIGPDGTSRDYPASLDGTPVFLGCSDVDFHIPKERVQHTSEVMRKLGGDVTERLYPNMGHTVNEDEIAFVKSMMDTVIKEQGV